MNRLALAILIGWLIANQLRLWREFRRLDSFAIRGQMRTWDELNRVNARLPTLKGETFENRFTKPVYPADLWRQD